MALRVAEALYATGGGGISCVCYTGVVCPQNGLQNRDSSPLSGRTMRLSKTGYVHDVGSS